MNQVRGIVLPVSDDTYRLKRLEYAELDPKSNIQVLELIREVRAVDEPYPGMIVSWLARNVVSCVVILRKKAHD